MIKYLALALMALATVHGAKQEVVDLGDKPADFCQGCKSIISYVSRFNSTESRPDVKNVFTQFCQLYNPVSTDNQQGLCPVIVEAAFYIMDRTDPVTFCDQVDACEYYEITEAASALELAESSSDSGLICNVCQDTLSQLQKRLESPEFIKYFREQIDALCEYLKVVNEDQECKKVLNDNFDQAIDFIRKIDVVKYCKSISLCTPNTITRAQSKPTLADFSNFGIETNVEIGNKAIVLQEETSKPDHGPNCLICKVVVREMFKFLKDNRTEANIELALDKVCGLIYKGGSKLQQCEEMVTSYSKELLNLLADETDPELVCMLLEQCYDAMFKPEPRAKLEPINLGQFISLLEPSIQVGSMRACVECKIFIKFLRNAIEDPKNSELVKVWIKQNLCASLEDKKLTAQCNQMVDTYAESFLKGILMELSPQATCIEVGACKKRQRLFIDNLMDAATEVQEDVHPLVKVAKMEQPVKVEQKPCDVCVEIITKIDSYLSEHDINQDINVIVDQVCKKIPQKTLADECTFLVNTYGQEIIQAIALMDDPRQLCSSINLC